MPKASRHTGNQWHPCQEPSLLGDGTQVSICIPQKHLLRVLGKSLAWERKITLPKRKTRALSVGASPQTRPPLSTVEVGWGARVPGLSHTPLQWSVILELPAWEEPSELSSLSLHATHATLVVQQDTAYS